MASDCSDDCVFDFPPLFQNMRLNIEGGPKYRGGRSGRAAVAYYREKEVMIAMKNKYGNRYGRRIQYYKPDNEAWKPERYQRHVGILNSHNHTSEVIPGGLQNKKTLLQIDHEWLAQTSATVDQQARFSLRDHASDKYSSETIKSDGVLETDHRTSLTLDLAKLERPTQSGRGMMRGKRVVDLFAMYCEDEKEVTASPEKRESEISLQNDQGDVRNFYSDQSPSELIKTDEKEQLRVSPEVREPEISLKKDQVDVRNCDSGHSSSELIKTVSDLLENTTSISLQSQTKVLSEPCQGVCDTWEDVSLMEPHGYQETYQSKQPYTSEGHHSCGTVIPITRRANMDGTKLTSEHEGCDATSNTQTSAEKVPMETISTSGAGAGSAQEVENITEQLDKVRIKPLSQKQRRKLLKEKMIKEGKEWLSKRKWRESKGLKPKTS